MQQLKWPNTLADLEAAANEVRGAGSASVVGYCWGGTVAHVAASELDLDAAVSYYGGGVAKMLDKKPHCPIMYHFGDQDGVDPDGRHREDQERESRRGYYVYQGAGHGFNCDERGSYSAPDAKARVRSLDRVLATSRPDVDRGRSQADSST